jgi:hypothetical protein
VTGDTDEPTGYDAWVLYDPNQVDPVGWDDLIKLPGAISITRSMTSRLNAGAFYTWGAGPGISGDGAIVRIELDAISGGPACFTFGFAKAYSSPGRTHPTSPRAAMLAINEDCPTEDSDGDDVFDICDNCPDDHNLDQADMDGDGAGDACDNCLDTVNPGQENADGDQWGDACETADCIDVPTEWVTPTGDSDCDGFTTSDENFVGTDPNLACSTDRWPPDFNSDHDVDIFDINLLKPAFFSCTPGPPYDVRFDLRPDDCVDIFDINRLKPFFFLSCTP